MEQIQFLLPFVLPVPICLSFLPLCDIYPSSSDVIIFTWVHMFSKYVKFWKYRVDLLMKLRFLKSFIEIVQKDMFGRNLPKPYNFIINTKRQNSIKCQ
jgi:hypothetical protein